MDQDKVNPFVGNTETPAGGTPVSATPTASVDSAVSAPDPVNPVGSTQAGPAIPVNPYAPAGAPYAPGSNTPAPSYADPISPAVPNTSAPDPAYTSFSPAPSQDFIPMDTPERPKLFTKKFVIFAVIGLVLIAGAVVAGLVLQRSRSGSGSGSSNSSITSSSNTMKNINRYMNYILYGTDADTKVQNDPENGAPIFIEKALGNVDNVDINAAKLMTEKWKTFISEYNESKPEAIKNFIDNNQPTMDFFDAYVADRPLTEEEIVNSYFKGDTDREYVEKKYSRYRKISTLADEYVNNQIEYVLATFEKIKIYQFYGCVIEQKLNSDCLVSKNLSDEEQEAISKSIEFLYKAKEVYNTIVGQIDNNSWMIYSAMSNMKEWEEL